MIVRMYYEGGAGFMLIIYTMWIIVLTQAVRFIILYRLHKSPLKLKRTNDSILFLGGLTFLIGAMGQMLGLIGAFDAIQRAGDVSPALIAGGLKVSFITPFFGLALLSVSAIIWFVFRNLKEYPSVS